MNNLFFEGFDNNDKYSMYVLRIDCCRLFLHNFEHFCKTISSKYRFRYIKSFLTVCGIYVRKSREKRFLEKKPGNKNFGKKSEIKSCVLDSWDFSLKIVWGLPIK